MEIKEVTDCNQKEMIARRVLHDLPEWFGIPDALEHYITESRKKPFLACFDNGHVVGFVVLHEASKDCAEIFVMGVVRAYHRKGIGRQLNAAYEDLARRSGYSYSQVKTVQMGHYEEYDATNNFYLAMGYKEFECFPEFWDSWNPCQVYVKHLRT